MVIVVGAICAVVAFVSGSWRWLILAPLVLLFLMLVSPLFPFSKRNITSQQFADELEQHLLGTEEDRIGVITLLKDNQGSTIGRSAQ